MLHARVDEDFPRKLRVACGYENKLQTAGFDDLFELVLSDLVRRPIRVLKHQIAALQSVVDPVSTKVKSFGLVRQHVYEARQGALHLFDVHNVASVF
jgi:hypothetical protein